MAEIGPVAAKRLGRLRRDFLTMSPSEQQSFVEDLRFKRTHPRVLKRVKTTKTGDNNANSAKEEKSA